MSAYPTGSSNVTYTSGTTGAINDSYFCPTKGQFTTLAKQMAIIMERLREIERVLGVELGREDG